MPPTLGERLRHAREKRGLALADVAHATKIPVARLQDLENDNLTAFGNLTYAKSFLKTYAALLDVNADEVLNRIPSPPLGGLRDYRYLVENYGPWVSKHSEQPALVPDARITSGRSFGFAALICLGVGVIIGGGVLAHAFFHSRAADNLSANSSAESKSVAGPAIPVAILVEDPPPAPEQSSLSPEAFRVPSPGEPAFPVVAPKAQPVPDKPASKTRRGSNPPKDQSVR